MIEWVVTDEGIRVFDHAKVEIGVRASDATFEPTDDEFPRPIDETVAATTSEVRLPSVFVRITRLDGEYTREFGGETGPIELDEGRYLLDLGSLVKTYVLFEGPATLRKTDDFETLAVSFEDRQDLTFGFRSLHEQPVGTITVPDSPRGIATALSYVHSSLKTTDSNRSFPTLRGHPPRVEIGDAVNIPEPVADSTVDTGIRLRVPSDIDHLYVLAPLAYYLQAEVVANGVDTPVLEARSVGIERTLAPLPELQGETARLLRKVFYLDCLVRNVGPYGTDLAEADALDSMPLDPEEAYEATPAERLAQYLDVPYELLDPHVPEWHLATYVEPDTKQARSLPYLLERLSLVYLPETSELDGAELMERSLDDFYRGAAISAPPGFRKRADAASVDLLKPELGSARMHGWLADGVPIDVFKATHAGFENRFDYLTLDRDHNKITVVLNDEEMASEHDEVARIYRDRAEDLPMEVDVYEYLDRDELAAIFEDDNDFVHYIGHCEKSGLRCPDGNLSVSDLDECNAQTFFLNACGSYYEGMKLVEKGSVVGGVTFKKVLDKQAAIVGTTFARLLINGFNFDHAIRLARRRIMTGKDYAVVGDGTHTLTQCEGFLPQKNRIEEADTGFELTADSCSVTFVGGFYQLNLDDHRVESHLIGNPSTYSFTRGSLMKYLERVSEPVVHDGDFYWSTELTEQLSKEQE